MFKRIPKGANLSLQEVLIPLWGLSVIVLDKAQTLREKGTESGRSYKVGDGRAAEG